MRSLGVIANIQPQFVPTDARWIQDKLAPELMKYAYAWKTLLDNGTYRTAYFSIFCPSCLVKTSVAGASVVCASGGLRLFSDSLTCAWKAGDEY